MLSEEEVFERYRKHSVVPREPGEEIYLALQTALEFVTTCQENDLAVLGIEGFLYSEGMIHPQLDMIADYSPELGDDLPRRWKDYRDLCNDSASSFLPGREPRDDLMFSFVIVSQPERNSLVTKSNGPPEK